MSRVLLLSDIHVGHRNDSPIHDKHLREYFVSIIIPYCIENGIRNIIVAGDLFDRRKFINFEILYKWKREVFDVLNSKHIDLHVVLGNHDVAFKNTNRVNSPSLLLAEYNNVIVYEHPTDVEIEHITFAMIPWITEDNREAVYEYINRTAAPVAIAHLELNGFAMRPGELCEHGIDASSFEKFSAVYTGHFHLQSEQKGIRYLGCPTEHSLGEAGHATGFHVLDTSTFELTFFENPNKLYLDIIYTGKTTIVPSGLEGKFVRIFNKAKDKKFESFVAGVEAHLKPFRIECFDVAEDTNQAEIQITDLKDVQDLTHIIKDIVFADTSIDDSARENILKIAYELHQACQVKQ